MSDKYYHFYDDYFINLALFHKSKSLKLNKFCIFFIDIDEITLRCDLYKYQKLTLMSNICLYQSSKYYKKSFSNPCDVIEPLGYDFLKQGDKPSQKKKKLGELVYQYIIEKSNIKQISYKGTPTGELSKYLKISQAQRKNYYVTSSILQLIHSKINSQLLSQLEEKYYPNGDKQMLHYIEFLGILSTFSEESFYFIKDYSLTDYFIYYEGQNQQVIQHLKQILNKEFLEYNVEMLIKSTNNTQPSSIFSKKINYKDLNEVKNLMEEINKINQEKDINYCGVHLYISDWVQPKISNDILKQQQEHWPLLQYHIFLLTGILADGQNAILKIRGTYTHKTSELLFLLKLAFHGKICLHKNILSNPFSNQKYIICQNYNQRNGKIINQYLENNYHLLEDEGANKLLVNPQIMFSQDFQTNVSTFNDLCSIFKFFKERHHEEFLQNANMQFYPQKKNLIKKLEEMKCKIQVMEYIQQSIPFKESNQDKTGGKENEFVEKAGIQIHQLFDSYPIAVPQTKTQDLIKNLKQKEQDQMNEYFERCDNEKKKKEKEKEKNKKTAKKKQEEHQF